MTQTVFLFEGREKNERDWWGGDLCKFVTSLDSN